MHLTAADDKYWIIFSLCSELLCEFKPLCELNCVLHIA